MVVVIHLGPRDRGQQADACQADDATAHGLLNNRGLYDDLSPRRRVK
jgi:hypothetical protein